MHGEGGGQIRVFLLVEREASDGYCMIWAPGQDGYKNEKKLEVNNCILATSPCVTRVSKTGKNA